MYGDEMWIRIKQIYKTKYLKASIRNGWCFFVNGEISFYAHFTEGEVSAVANRIGGITVEIGGDTAKLQATLKCVNGQIKSTQQQLKDVDKLFRVRKIAELLAQKQKLLAAGLEMRFLSKERHIL